MRTYIDTLCVKNMKQGNAERLFEKDGEKNIHTKFLLVNPSVQQTFFTNSANRKRTFVW